MSNMRFWMPVAALGLGMVLAGGLNVAHAQQAGATDPSFYNTAGPGASNELRPTLVLPERPKASAAAHPGDAARVSGWSPVGGPYSNSRGHAESSNATTSLARR